MKEPTKQELLVADVSQFARSMVAFGVDDKLMERTLAFQRLQECYWWMLRAIEVQENINAAKEAAIKKSEETMQCKEAACENGTCETSASN